MAGRKEEETETVGATVAEVTGKETITETNPTSEAGTAGTTEVTMETEVAMAPSLAKARF